MKYLPPTQLCASLALGYDVKISRLANTMCFGGEIFMSTFSQIGSGAVCVNTVANSQLEIPN
uniref:Uncharacterized protein n=1 Tax=Anguilla anguilla TaxID=7936 RepID=A0A0E9SYC0_ANGAN